MSTKDKQRVTDPKLIKHAKAQAVIEDKTLTGLMETVLIKYLPEEIVIIKSKI